MHINLEIFAALSQELHGRLFNCLFLKTPWGLEINLKKLWPQVDLYFRVNRKWDHISRTIQQIIKLFSVINSLGIKYNFWQTVTSSWPLLPGQPEVGPYLKKYTTDFQTFFSYRLLGHSRLVWNTFDPMLTFTSGSTGSGPISQEVQSQCSNFSYRL